jgi:DNA-binding transcriptional LysR family regulator
MELDQIRIALVLGEELHFGRTASRLRISQSRVSQRLAALERELGGMLFDRTSRRVRLTPLGVRFRDEVGAAYEQLLAAGRSVSDAGRRLAGEIRIGFTPTTAGRALADFVRAFERRYPDVSVIHREVSFAQPYDGLRSGEIDILLMWRTGAAGGDLTEGPAIDRQERVAMMAADHPLAGRRSISTLEVDRWVLMVNFAPAQVLDAILPPTNVDGTPIPRVRVETSISTMAEYVAHVAKGSFVHPTVRSLSELVNRDDLTYVPFDDLPPVDLCLVWCRSHESATIRAAAAVAETIDLPPG